MSGHEAPPALVRQVSAPARSLVPRASVTEIPEHLLARSEARREAIGQDRGDGARRRRGRRRRPRSRRPRRGGARRPPPLAGRARPRPRRAGAAAGAANRCRRGRGRPEPASKIPWWAMPAVAGLAVWAVALRLHPRAADDRERLLIVGATSSTRRRLRRCHGATGGGGVRPGLHRRRVVETFPDFNDHIDMGRPLGGQRPAPTATYGDTGRAGRAAHRRRCPAFGAEHADSPRSEIALVVRYEREVLGRRSEPELARSPTRVRRRGPTRRRGRGWWRPGRVVAAEAGDGDGGAGGRPRAYASGDVTDARRARRRRRPGGSGGRVLVGQGRPRRRRRRAQDLPREKTCGDGLTPRAVHQLEEMGLEPSIVAPATTATTACGPCAHGITLELEWPEHPSSRPTATSCAGATSTGWSPTTPSRPAPPSGQGTEAVAPADRGRPGARRGGARTRRRASTARSGPATWSSPTAPTPASAGPSARPANRDLPAGHGHPRLLREPAARRPVDRERPRRPRPQRQLAARLRLDLPGGRRDHQRRHRPAVDVPGLEVGQHLAPHERVRGHARRRTGGSARTTSCGPPTGGRLPMGGSVVTQRRAHLGGGRRRRRDRSTRSTARASTTPTRPAAWRPGCIDEALATGDGMALQRYPPAARGRVRPLLQGGPPVRQGDRQPGAAATS